MGLFSFLGIGKKDKEEIDNNVSDSESKNFDNQLDSNLMRLSELTKEMTEIINDNKDNSDYVKETLSQNIIPTMEQLILENESILNIQKNQLKFTEGEIIDIEMFNKNCQDILSKINESANIEEHMDYIIRLEIANHKILTNIGTLRAV